MRGNDVGELVRVHGRAGGLRVADALLDECLTELCDEPDVVLRVEEPGVHAEHLGNAAQHRRRERTGVVLDLVQVGRRDAQVGGEAHL